MKSIMSLVYNRVTQILDLIVKLGNMTESELIALTHDEIQDMAVVKTVMNLTSICIA